MTIGSVAWSRQKAPEEAVVADVGTPAIDRIMLTRYLWARVEKSVMEPWPSRVVP